MGAAFAFITPVCAMVLSPDLHSPAGLLPGMLFGHPGIIIGLVCSGVAIARCRAARRTVK